MQHQTNGARFVVTSYGSKPVIESFLKRLGILYLFDAVMTPSFFGLLDGYNVFTQLKGKNVMLERVARHYGIPQSQILLLDDSPGNINTAKASKYPAVQVNPSTALTITEGYLIEKFLKN
jgi:phosphoglycolate phosphatase-like HAD superfamily hydrolase